MSFVRVVRDRHRKFMREHACPQCGRTLFSAYRWSHSNRALRRMYADRGRIRDGLRRAWGLARPRRNG